MVECMNPALPISRQCRVLALPRSSVYRKPAEVDAEDLAIMALIDRQYLVRPYFGSRRMAAWLATQGHAINRKRAQRLMRLLGLAAIYQRPNTSKPALALDQLKALVFPFKFTTQAFGKRPALGGGQLAEINSSAPPLRLDPPNALGEE